MLVSVSGGVVTRSDWTEQCGLLVTLAYPPTTSIMTTANNGQTSRQGQTHSQHYNDWAQDGGEGRRCSPQLCCKVCYTSGCCCLSYTLMTICIVTAVGMFIGFGVKWGSPYYHAQTFRTTDRCQVVEASVIKGTSVSVKTITWDHLEISVPQREKPVHELNRYMESKCGRDLHPKSRKCNQTEFLAVYQLLMLFTSTV